MNEHQSGCCSFHLDANSSKLKMFLQDPAFKCSVHMCIDCRNVRKSKRAVHWYCSDKERTIRSHPFELVTQVSASNGAKSKAVFARAVHCNCSPYA